MRLTFGLLRKGEKEPARLKSQSADVELTEAELKHVYGGVTSFNGSGKNPAGNKAPGQSTNPNPGK